MSNPSLKQIMLLVDELQKIHDNTLKQKTDAYSILDKVHAMKAKEELKSIGTFLAFVSNFNQSDIDSIVGKDNPDEM